MRVLVYFLLSLFIRWMTANGVLRMLNNLAFEQIIQPPFASWNFSETSVALFCNKRLPCSFMLISPKPLINFGTTNNYFNCISDIFSIEKGVPSRIKFWSCSRSTLRLWNCPTNSFSNFFTSLCWWSCTDDFRFSFVQTWSTKSSVKFKSTLIVGKSRLTFFITE